MDKTFFSWPISEEKLNEPIVLQQIEEA